MRTETKLGLVAIGIASFLFCLVGAIGSLVYLSLMPTPPDAPMAQSAKDTSTSPKAPQNAEPTGGITTKQAFPETKAALITGTVQSLNTTGFNERLFWKVEEGKGYAYVETKPGERVVCVFRGGLPASLKTGDICSLEGRSQGIIPSAGIFLYTDCVLVPRDRP